MAGADVPDVWNCYPWDAAAYGHSIAEHEELARVCAGEELASNNFQWCAGALLAGAVLGAGMAVLGPRLTRR